MPANSSTLRATAPNLTDVDGPDFKVRFCKSGTKLRVTFNNGAVQKWPIIPKPKNLNNCKLKEVMNCGEGGLQPKEVYLDYRAKVRCDLSALTGGRAICFDDLSKIDLHTVLTSLLATYPFFYCFPNNWAGREIVKSVCRNKRDTVTNKKTRKKAKVTPAKVGLVASATAKPNASKPTTVAPTKSTAPKAKGGASAGPKDPTAPRPSTNLKLAALTLPASDPPAPAPRSEKRSAQGPLVGQSAPIQKKAKTSAPQADLRRNDSWGDGLDQQLQELRTAAAETGKKRKKTVDEPPAASVPIPAPKAASTAKPQKRPRLRAAPAPEESILGAPALAVTTRAEKAELIDEVEMPGGEGSRVAPTQKSTRNKNKPSKA